jgi:hypothetical protein
LKTGALKAARKALKAEKEVRLDPFHVVSHSRSERHVDVILRHDDLLHHEDVDLVERSENRKLYFYDTTLRSQQLPLLMVEAKMVPVTDAAYFHGALKPANVNASVHIGGVFAAYLTSMLVMFVQETARLEPEHLRAVEGRLKRLERVVLANPLAVEERGRVNWEDIERALSKAATAFQWRVEWNVDREKASVVGRVHGLEYRLLARQRLDFYEHIASAVDKETFKAVSFDLEPAE